MRIRSFLRANLAALLGPPASSRPRARRPRVREFDRLDRRELLSTVSVLSATTVDSRSVTVSYDVTGSDPSLEFGVYRSTGPEVDGSSVTVQAPTAAPGLDDAGLPSTAPGVHQLTIPLPGGLPINPKHPYVVVQADPGSAASTGPGGSASFRKVVIGIVTHGGLEDSAWKKDGPPWERQMAQSLRDQGYDDVIAYNWVAQSSSPGQAVKQGPILANLISKEVAKVPANEVVDLHFIGHSEGAVVNTGAIDGVEANPAPNLKAGFLEDTLLDPHAANPDFPGKQYSVADNPIGWIAQQFIDNYQSRARDPFATIPARVDASQVFYQQSPASRDHNENLGIYNLWGQVPVKGATVYFNLTSDGIVHSGKNGVYAWYEHHVVPTLGDGGQPIARETLTGSGGAAGQTISTPQATYSGTSAPGSTVELLVGKAGPSKLSVAGRSVTRADGTWTATTNPLPDGHYRVVAVAELPKAFPGDRPPVPTASLGSLVVQG